MDVLPFQCFSSADVMIKALDHKKRRKNLTFKKTLNFFFWFEFLLIKKIFKNEVSLKIPL